MGGGGGGGRDALSTQESYPFLIVIVYKFTDLVDLE